MMRIAGLHIPELRVASAIGLATAICAAGACTPNGPLVPAAATSAGPSAAAAPTLLPPPSAPQVFRCSRVEFSAAPSAAEVGELLTFTATAYGCDPIDYRFLWLQVDTGDWQVAQDWGPSPAWTWNTSTFSPAGYSIVADARARYELGNGPDASVSTPVMLTAPSTPAPSPPRAGRCAAVSLTISPASTVTVGTVVVVKMSASGCREPEYRLYVVDLSTEATTLVRDWGPSPDGVWDTRHIPPGSYAIHVDARAAGAGQAGYAFDASSQARLYIEPLPQA